MSVNSLRKVLLLQPDGPINTVNSPGARAPRFERVLKIIDRASQRVILNQLQPFSGLGAP